MTKAQWPSIKPAYTRIVAVRLFTHTDRLFIHLDKSVVCDQMSRKRFHFVYASLNLNEDGGEILAHSSTVAA